MSLSKCREIPEDREAWGAAVCGVAKSCRTERLNNSNGGYLMDSTAIPDGQADDPDRTQLASPRSHPLRAAVNVKQMNCLFLELSISYFWTPHLITCD